MSDEKVRDDTEPAGLAYTRLPVEQQRELLELRLRNLESEHFQHDSNLKIASSSGNDEVVTQSKAAMVTIEQAHAAVTSQLKKLKG